jgi:cutinase
MGGGANTLAVQGVEYPADIPGFLAGGDADGSAAMLVSLCQITYPRANSSLRAKLVTQAMTQCPSTKVVMSGYRLVTLLI